MSDKRTNTAAKYRIGAIARATGINAETLRIWERRYGLPRPGRSEAGGRLYSDDDVARLRLIKQLIDRGHAIGRLAKLDDDDLRAALAQLDPKDARLPLSGLETIRTRFLDLIVRLEVTEAQALLSRAALILDTRTLVLELLVPTLRELGDRWANNSARVCHEHAASSMVRTVLGTLLASQPAPIGGRRMVLGTPAGETHEFGALLAALLAGAAGWRVTYLGADLPAEELAAAAEMTSSEVVAISVLGPVTPQKMAGAEALLACLPSRATLLAGGSAARLIGPLTERATIIDDLGDFAGWLDQGGWIDARP